MKNKKSILTVSLLVCLTLCGCKINEKNQTESATEIVSHAPYEGGTHIYNKELTNNFLFKDGDTNYTFVVSSEASLRINKTVTSAIAYIKEATGFTFSIMNDGEFNSSSYSNYISVGNTTLLQSNNINIDGDLLSDSGFRITTKNNNIFVFGYTDYGTSYGIYEFLHQTINFKFYAKDAYYIDSNLSSISLYNFDITDCPDFEYRTPGDYIAYDSLSPEYLSGVDPIATTAGWQWHNTFRVANPTQYKLEHPSWYADSGKQLCYTCHGDAEELAELSDLVYNQLINDLAAQPTKSAITFTHEDTDGWCNCEACRADINKYKAKAATLIKFINPIAERVENWLKNEFPGRNVTILIFAYIATLNAPCERVNGEYVPTGSEMYLRDNVGVVYAPITAKYEVNFEDELNVVQLEAMESWTKITKSMWYWTYSTDFNDYLAPYDGFSSMKDNYIIMLNHGAKWSFNQAQGDENSPTHFTYLKAFLSSKLEWNVNQDVNQLTDEFFEHYFKDASSVMFDYYSQLRLNFNYIFTKANPSSSSIYFDVNSNMYSYSLLLDWMKLFDEAYKTIEKYKISNSALYQKLYNRINLESISIRYLIIKLYGIYYSDSELLAMKKQFKFDCGYLGVTKWKEGRPIANLWEAWGI